MKFFLITLIAIFCNFSQAQTAIPPTEDRPWPVTNEIKMEMKEAETLKYIEAGMSLLPNIAIEEISTLDLPDSKSRYKAVNERLTERQREIARLEANMAVVAVLKSRLTPEDMEYMRANIAERQMAIDAEIKRRRSVQQ